MTSRILDLGCSCSSEFHLSISYDHVLSYIIIYHKIYLQYLYFRRNTASHRLFRTASQLQRTSLVPQGSLKARSKLRGGRDSAA